MQASEARRSSLGQTASTAGSSLVVSSSSLRQQERARTPVEDQTSSHYGSSSHLKREHILVLVCAVLALAGIMFAAGYKLGGASAANGSSSTPTPPMAGLPRVNSLLDLCRDDNNRQQQQPAYNNITVGVYYYPWYGGRKGDFHGGLYVRYVV